MKSSEVMILGDICVLSVTYSYVDVCRFCDSIVCFCLLFSIYSTYVFQYSFYVCFFVFVFYFVYSVFLYCFVYCFSFCAVSFLFFYKSTDRCHQVENQLQ